MALIKFGLLVVVFVVSGYSARALPIAFERNYTNDSWGNFNNGCFIDQQRFVYVYDMFSDAPVKLVGRVKAGPFARAQELLALASRSAYERKSVAVDAGSTTWDGKLGPRTIRIQEYGNVTADRGDVGAKLVSAIEAWCPRTTGGPHPHQPLEHD